MRLTERSRLIVHFVIISSLSLFWARSYWYADTLSVFIPCDMLQSVTSFRGRTVWLISDVHCGRYWSWSLDLTSVGVVGSDEHAPRYSPADLSNWYFSGDEREWLKPKLIALAGSRAIAPGQWAVILHIPHWFWMIIVAVVPLNRLWKLRRASRWTSQNRCRFCGYDLRASAGRCPECGAESPPLL